MDGDLFCDFLPEESNREVVHLSAATSTFRNVAGISRISEDDEDDEENEIYREKYLKIKKIAKGLIFENACLCDEVSQLQEKIVIAKEERRFLLKKFLYFEAQKEAEVNAQNSNMQNVVSGFSCNKSATLEMSESQAKKKNPTKKKPPPKSPDEPAKARNKKKKKLPVEKKEKKFVQPIPLDCSGRPIFPILLGSLTVHSLGVIIHDRPGFHDESAIFPVGYCSSRIYISLKNPPNHCLYTCTIIDTTFGPRFEVTAEDNPEHPIISNQLNECHSYVLRSINILCGRELLNAEGQGAKFFGLSHPIVQNLIQSCAGARKCCHYRWIQFEVNRPKSEGDNKLSQESDPTINYEALQNLLLERS